MNSLFLFNVWLGIVKTPIGLIPEIESLDLRGCGVSTAQVSVSFFPFISAILLILLKVKKSLSFNKQEWKKECESISAFYQSLGPGILISFPIILLFSVLLIY